MARIVEIKITVDVIIERALSNMVQQEPTSGKSLINCGCREKLHPLELVG